MAVDDNRVDAGSVVAVVVTVEVEWLSRSGDVRRESRDLGSWFSRKVCCSRWGMASERSVMLETWPARRGPGDGEMTEVFVDRNLYVGDGDEVLYSREACHCWHANRARCVSITFFLFFRVVGTVSSNEVFDAPLAQSRG